jgi:hypothetical protein
VRRKRSAPCDKTQPLKGSHDKGSHEGHEEHEEWLGAVTLTSGDTNPFSSFVSFVFFVVVFCSLPP